MKLFFAYIRQRRKEFLPAALFALIFIIMIALYRLPLAAAGYPLLLSALTGALLITLDFTRMRKRHKRLERLKELAFETISDFPEAESIEEHDYQEIIRILQEESGEKETKALAGYQELVDYYTAWVHQIKTPIASMRLTLQNEDSSLTRRLSADLSRIEQYVEMVLAYLRLDSVSSDYVFKEYSLDAIIRQAVAKFAAEFIDRRIRLQYEPVGRTVVTDEKWLSFVIEQVLSNALKYTREGTVKIYLKEPCTLCIEDTGIGIAPDDLPRIFEKGYTGYNGRRDKKASGLGLYLCKRVCGNLGAGLTAASEPDKGTTVFICLEQYGLQKE